MSLIEDRLRQLGLELPPARAPVANYVSTKRSGDLLFVSGKLSDLRGEVGDDGMKKAFRECLFKGISICLFSFSKTK